MRIKTDNHWKPFRYRNEVPAKILREQFGYQNPEDVVDGFIHYRKRWYHLNEFMIVTDNSPFEGWHGYKRTPFFSAVVIRVSSDGEMYQIGMYYS